MSSCSSCRFGTAVFQFSDAKNDSEISQGEFGDGASCSRQHVLRQLLLLHLQCGDLLLHRVLTHKPVDQQTPQKIIIHSWHTGQKKHKIIWQWRCKLIQFCLNFSHSEHTLVGCCPMNIWICCSNPALKIIISPLLRNIYFSDVFWPFLDFLGGYLSHCSCFASTVFDMT